MGLSDNEGICQIGETSSWNDAISSFKLYGGTTRATLTLCKDTNGGGSSVTATVAADGEVDVASLPGTYGSSWNDAVSSLKVTY